MRGRDEGVPFSPSMPLSQLTLLLPLLWAPAVTTSVSNSIPRAPRPPHHCQATLLCAAAPQIRTARSSPLPAQRGSHCNPAGKTLRHPTPPLRRALPNTEMADVPARDPACPTSCLCSDNAHRWQRVPSRCPRVPVQPTLQGDAFAGRHSEGVPVTSGFHCNVHTEGFQSFPNY